MEHNDNTQMPAAAISKVLQRLGLQAASDSSEMQDDQLVAALSSPDWSVRLTALHMLGERDAPTELLVNAIQDEHASVRVAAIQILGKRSGHIPVEPLITALQHDPEWSVRAMAALTLRMAAGPIPVEPLLDALHDEDEFSTSLGSTGSRHYWRVGGAGGAAPCRGIGGVPRKLSLPIFDAAGGE